jgi:hypothetical protein
MRICRLDVIDHYFFIPETKVVRFRFILFGSPVFIGILPLLDLDGVLLRFFATFAGPGTGPHPARPWHNGDKGTNALSGSGQT